MLVVVRFVVYHLEQNPSLLPKLLPDQIRSRMNAFAPQVPALLVRSHLSSAARFYHLSPLLGAKPPPADASILASLRSPLILDVRDPEEVLSYLDRDWINLAHGIERKLLFVLFWQILLQKIFVCNVLSSPPLRWLKVKAARQQWCPEASTCH